MNTKRLVSNVRTTFLSIIADQGPLYGIEIALEYQRRTGSPKALNAGTLVPNLRRLEQLGWVNVEEKCPKDLPRVQFPVSHYPRVQFPVSHYTISEAGQRALADGSAAATPVLRWALKIFRGFRSP